MAEYSDFEWTSPRIEIGEFTLTYLNTRIRLFGTPWEHLNHVEFTDDNGKLCGMTVTQELMDTLYEHEFSYLFQYYPDSQTQGWWLNIVGQKLQEDIEELEQHGITPTA